MSKKVTKKMINDDINNAVAVYIAAFYENAEAEYRFLIEEADKDEEIWAAGVLKQIQGTKKGKAFLDGAVAKSFFVGTSYRHLPYEDSTLTLTVRDRRGFNRTWECPQTRVLVKLKDRLGAARQAAQEASHKMRRHDNPHTTQDKIRRMRELMSDSPKLRRTLLKAVEKAIADTKK